MDDQSGPDKTGRLSIDPGPTFVVHACILAPGEKDQKSALQDFEFGKEYDFLSSHHAAESQETVDGKEYDKLSLSLEGYSIFLWSQKGKQQPLRVSVAKDGKLLQQIDYDEYVSGIPFQTQLFQPSADIKITGDDFSEWMMHFSQTQDIGKFDGFWRYTVDEKDLESPGHGAPLKGFFSQVFHKYPSLLKGRLDDLSRFPEAQQQVLIELLWLSDTNEAKAILKANGKGDLASVPVPAVSKRKIHEASDLDFCWGAYFATGDPGTLDPIISTLDLGKYAGALNKYTTSQKTPEDREAAIMDAIFGAAMWSLSSNARKDAGILAYMEKVFADPNMPKSQSIWLGGILSKIKPEKYKLANPIENKK